MFKLLVIRPQNQQSQVVPINSITSCYLSGVVFDVSVSFFVDMGEDVSLLNSRVLGRIKPSDINKLYIECYKSVEVDGHPLKVHGSIIMPLIIN